MADRMAAIEALLAKNPDDVFLHYSLGMLHGPAGNDDAAMREFRRCIELDSNYLPAHVEAGKTLRAAGKLQEARRTFTDALQLAAAKGDGHTADYIRQQLEGLPA